MVGVFLCLNLNNLNFKDMSYTTEITEYRPTNREDVLLELVSQRTSLINWLSGAAINDNNINGSITKYNMMQKELDKVDKLIEQLSTK